MKVLTLLVFASTMLFNAFDVKATPPAVQWVTMEKAVELTRSNPRKIFVYIHTEWCGWCRRMESETFSNAVIVDYLNTNFYAVKLNAEETEPITFRGVTYENDGARGRRTPHGFATAILQGRMSYPAIAFFDEQLQLITSLPGFRPPANLEAVLTFFHDDVFENDQNLDAFIQNFQGQIRK